MAYQGRALSSGDRAWWQVQVRDADGQESLPSKVAWWEMGLLSARDWMGAWISDGKPNPESDADFYRDDPAPLLRRTFAVDRAVRRARLYTAGLGYYEVRLNGSKVSDSVLDPPWTDFRQRVTYATHDVTPLLREGQNAMGAMLGNGWYNPLPLQMWGRINLREHVPVGRPGLLAQLIVEYSDGTSLRIGTDGSWKVADGPIIRNSVYLGEEYDAREEQPGWDSPGFDDSQWRPATEAEPSTGPNGASGQSLRSLRAMSIPPIRVTATIKPVSATEVTPGVWIFDLGQNFAGWARLRVSGPRGTRVVMRTGELLHDDGNLNPMTAVAGQIKRLRADGSPVGGPGAPEVAWQADTYTLRGEGLEEYTPRFTFHGFRYVEVTGYPGIPSLDAIEGLRLNTDVVAAGSFSCSSERVNRIQKMTEWTLLSNLFSVQSDCPAREKFQYGGDIVATSEMALMNFDMATFYEKTVTDHREAVRGPGWLTETAPFVGISAENYAEDAGPIGWGLAHPLLVAQLYRYYGDRRTVEANFETARVWVDLLEEASDGLVIDRCIGDHESLDPKPIAMMATAHFFQAATLVADFAGILDRRAEAAHYRNLADRIRRVFLDRFLKRGEGVFDSGTQAAQATAIHLGLVPEEEHGRAVDRMVGEVVTTHEGHIAAGIFGTRYLLDALRSTGNSVVAFQMVDRAGYPGWGHMLESGATTLWETWAASDNVYSHNHPMFGSVSEWFHKDLGGIRAARDAEGFDRFHVEPSFVPGLEWVDAAYESARGTIRSTWKRVLAGLELEVHVPVNTTALVSLPAANPDDVLESGRAIRSLNPVIDPDTRTLGLVLGSGTYRFSVPNPGP